MIAHYRAELLRRLPTETMVVVRPDDLSVPVAAWQRTARVVAWELDRQVETGVTETGVWARLVDDQAEASIEPGPGASDPPAIRPPMGSGPSPSS